MGSHRSVNSVPGSQRSAGSYGGDLSMSQRSDFGSSRSDVQRLGDDFAGAGTHPFMRRIQPARAHGEHVPPGSLVHPGTAEARNFQRRSSKGSAGSAREGSARGLSWEDKVLEEAARAKKRAGGWGRLRAAERRGILGRAVAFLMPSMRRRAYL